MKLALSDLDPAMRRMVLAVAFATLFEEYDTGILNAALKQIADELRIPEERLGLELAWIRAGALPAFLFLPLADRLGRRPMFLFSVAAMGTLTFATAFVQSLWQFTALQALVRTFTLAGAALAFVIVSEELPAERRGLGMGVLAAIGATGHGLGAGLYALIDVLPYGFRALYAFGFVPVLLLPWLARNIPETARFRSMEQAVSTATGPGFLLRMVAPLGVLMKAHPVHALGVSFAAFLVACAAMPAFQFASYFVQAKHGFLPGQYSLMVIAGGGVGILGNLVAGRLGDSMGRKRVGFVLLMLLPLAVLGLYRATPTWLIVLSWVGAVFFSMGGRLILRAVSTELFPTTLRGAASGVFSVLEAMGAVVGLLLAHTIGTRGVDSIALATPMVASASILAALIVLSFPETRARTLD
jgi:MFS family permease